MLDKPAELLDRLEQSGLLSPSIIERRDALLGTESAEKAADELVRLKLLTEYQARVAVKDGSVPLSIGDYLVEDQIGRGGMGFVLKARHRRMKRQVAIKFLHKSMTESPDLVARFEREVEAAAQLHHQNIVTAYDAGEHDGSHYLVMQYVDGEDLSHRVKREGPLRVSEAIDVIRQAAEGLGYAHEKGIVHRDIKPGNLLLDREGVVRILDMGLARMRPSPGDALDGGAHADLTNTGSVMGTVDYMAPEQALDAKTADFSADIYSLGCTLYFLLTGNPPFRSDTIMRRLLAHREQEVPLISHVRPEAPSELDQVFAKMMAKKKEDRYPSMQHLVVALKSIEYDDAEAEQTATIDAPDVGTGGFINLPESDQLDDPVEQSAFNDSSATTPNGSRVLDTASSAADATLIESDSQLSNTVVVSDADSLAQGESFSEESSTTSPPESPQSGAAQSGSSPPWKVIIPGIAAVLAIAILFAISRNGSDESGTPASLADAEPQTGTPTAGSGAATPDTGSLAGTAEPDSNDMSPDRRAAEWVVSIGGTVLVTVGQQNVKATDQSQLPDEPFFVVGVDLFSNPRVTDEGLTNLQGLSVLRSLVAWDTAISDAGLANLTDSGKQALPNLSTVHLQKTRIGDTGLSYLVGSPIDNSLLIAETGVSDPDVLREFGDVQHLNIGLTSVPLSRLDFLEDFNRLTVLNLDARQWNALAAAAPQFAGSLKQVSVFDRTSARVDERLLKEMPHLVSLSMNGPPESQFDEAFWTALAALPEFEDLRLDAEITDEALASLQPMSRLQTLHLDSTTISGHALVKAAQQLSGLKTLKLTNGSLTDNDVSSLATLKTLQQFNLNGNEITPDGIASLRQALPGCRIISDYGTFEATGSTTPNWALSFDGRDDYIEIPGLKYDGSSPITIEAWVAPRSIPVSATVISGGGIALNAHSDLHVWNMVSHRKTGGWDFARSKNPIELNRRVHLAGTFDGQRLTMFVDGERVARSRNVDFSGWESSIMIGADQVSIANGTDSGYFDGTIDEVRISRGTRYSDSFAPEDRFESDADTLALFHMDETSGKTLRDASGNGHDGVIHGATWTSKGRSATRDSGRFALSFDGEDDYVELPLTYDFSHPVTFEAWVTVRDATGQPVIIQRKEAAGAALALKVNRQPAWELVSRTTSGTYVGLAETPKVQTGQLTHVAGVFDLKRLTLFVNGMKYSDLRIEGKPVTANDVVKYARSAAPILIGAGGGKVHALDGFIDEVRISRTARYTASFVPSRELQSDDDTLALYHFDEGQGTVLRDSSGNGHDGTIHGAAWIERNSPDASKSDFALSFDGVDDFVEVRSLQHEPGSPITIEATVSDWGDQFGFICGWRACAGLAAFRDTLAGALGTTDLKNDQDQKIQKKVSGPHKAQIALVYDGRQGRLFSNGRLLGTMKLEHPLKPSSNRWSKGFAIGAASERSPDGFIAPVKGVIDEVRVSNIARYDSSYEPTGRLHADEHTMALYHFDSGQGSVLRDSSGNGHDGTIHGATWVSNASSSSLQGDTQQVREALEWLVSTGGWCTVKRPSDDDAIHWNVTTKDEIPDEPFVVLAVGSHVRRPADGGPRFEPLHQLRGLNAFHTNSAVTPEDLEWLQSSPELEVLHVHSTSPLNDEWAVWLQQFSKLRRVTWNRFGDAGLNHLAKIDSLEEIGLNPPATASGIRHLASLPNLRSVDLQYGQVTPDLVAAVAELPAVRKLIISWRERSIEPATWTEIEKLTQLEALWLKNMKLNDSAVPHLQKLTNLRDLQIQNSGISKQGVEQLRQSLRLADIKSDHGVFESAATVNRRAAEWILKHDGNVIVRSLSTGGDKGVKAGETLPDSPFHLVQINLNKTAPEDEFANLAGLTELEGAFINYFPLTDAALAHLKDSTKLRSLHLEGTQITTEGLDILQNFPALESLQLPAGQTDAVVPKLLTAKRLKRLGVGFKSERVSSLSQLSELDQLESLRLLYVDVTADSSSPGSLQFLQQLPNLTSFGLARCKVSTQCLRKLAKLNRLRELSLRDNFVEPDTLKELGQFLHLDSLTVTGAGLTDASTGLFDNLTNLKLLHVLKNELSPEGIATLRKSLPGCRIESDHGTFEATAPKPYTPPTTDGYSDRKLAELAVKIGGLAEVQDNAAGTKSHVKPSEELPKQPFRLISIQFESAITPDQAGQIAELSGNLRPFKGSESKQRGLSRLTLSATEIDDSVIRRLSGLQTARLVVDQTNISDQALVTIGKFEILILLRLKGTSITDKGLVHLEGLKSLRDLDLSETRVTETGVTRLSQALPECQIQWNKRTFKAGN